MSSAVNLRAQQMAMADYLRDPDEAQAPEVEPRRLKIYQDLIFNNIENFLSSGFPVLRSLYDETDWLALVRSFIKNHRSHSPYFLEISQEFLNYLMEEHEPRAIDAPFITELAHYEWVELALDVAEESVKPALGCENPLTAGLRLSPLAWLLSYQYPVHQIGASYRPETPDQPTYLVVYRDFHDKIQFIELNAATARLLELLRSEPADKAQTGAQALQGLAVEMGVSVESISDFGSAQLQEFVQRGVVLAEA